MKKFLVLIVFVSSLMAKAADDDQVSAYLFPQFEKGTVVLKGNNARVSALLNYDKVNDRMLFLETDSSLIELDSRTVLAVSIGDHTFIPVLNKGFYEMIVIGEHEYYICHKSKLISQGKAAGYGGYSQTSAIGSMASLPNQGGTLALIGCDEKFEGVDETSVFIKNGNKYLKITSLKSMAKIFKTHEATLESFAKEKNINFNQLDDVISIVEYAFSL